MMRPGMVQDEPAVPCGRAAYANMSAPPRMEIKIKPFVRPVPAGPAAAAAAASPAALGSLGLVPIGQVDLARLCRQGIPHPRKLSVPKAKQRIAALVYLSRLAAGIGPGEVLTLYGEGNDLLMDELRANAALLDPVALGLPAFGLVRKVKRDRAQAGPVITDPALALVLLTRTAGKVFIARRSPRVSHLIRDDHVYLFYGAPTGSPQGGQP
ncbi:hypothetical protein KJ682_06265 [bacterium]|nr:hypothetical protein [bacterium]